MTGVQSAQILGPTTQKQANKSKQAMDTEEAEFEGTFDASDHVENGTGNAGGTQSDGWADGGQDETSETKNGLDVIRTN
jgi:cell division protein FtsZ